VQVSVQRKFRNRDTKAEVKQIVAEKVYQIKDAKVPWLSVPALASQSTLFRKLLHFRPWTKP
jgi:hypothetical protein